MQPKWVKTLPKDRIRSTSLKPRKISLMDPREPLLLCISNPSAADIMKTYRSVHTKDNNRTGFGVESEKHKSHELSSSPMQRWLDETPKEQPWTSTSYHAKGSRENDNSTDAGEEEKDKKRHKTKDVTISPMQRWLNETPKEEPWTSIGHQARDWQKHSK